MEEIKYTQPKRGRKPGQKNQPKVEKTRFTQNSETSIGPRQFTREYFDKGTGVKSIWHYDLDKSVSGPYKTENVFPEGYVDEEPVNDEDLPLTKRQFLNPANGKYVGYGRAVQLGLYKPEPGEGKRGRPKK